MKIITNSWTMRWRWLSERLLPKLWKKPRGTHSEVKSSAATTPRDPTLPPTAPGTLSESASPGSREVAVMYLLEMLTLTIDTFIEVASSTTGKRSQRQPLARNPLGCKSVYTDPVMSTWMSEMKSFPYLLPPGTEPHFCHGVGEGLIQWAQESH